MKDIGASILARLKNKSKELDIPYQQCLQLFVQEEFLRRLSKSKYADNLILKGGYFIYTLSNFESRVTIDVDFLLKQVISSIEDVQKVIEHIVATPAGNDYIKMTAKKFEEISAQRKYKGVSAQITAEIKRVKIPFNIDIGVGDVILPHVQSNLVNTQLQDFEKPEIKTYSLESVIAEKFDAILQRFELTSRMKDFYDIYYISQTFDFEGLVLQEAMYGTLLYRKTAYESGSFVRIMGLVNDEAIQMRWRQFLKKMPGVYLEFSEVMTGIQQFLEPVFNKIVREELFSLNWNATKSQWG
ncbi:MAG: nucleotidyl transferase AbiEii/AbiGii toxin family protein [Turicibacter sp.]|nr:nucleotidyl transferase AbiEii/AbiGii toxin family protein [Turicibacter sp.]